VGYGFDKITLKRVKAMEGYALGDEKIIKAEADVSVGTGIEKDVLGGEVGDIGDSGLLPAEEEIIETGHGYS